MKKLLLALGLIILPLTANAKVTPYDFCVEEFSESMKDDEDAKQSIPNICKCFDSNFKEKMGEPDFKSMNEWKVYIKKLEKNPSKFKELQNFSIYCVMQNVIASKILEDSQVTYTNNRDKVVEDVTRIVVETRAIYYGRNDAYTRIPAGNESSDLLLSTGFRKSSDRNPFGGVYYITPATETDSDGTKKYFNVNITGLDKQNCFYLCAANWGGSHEDCDASTACKYDINNTLTLSFE